MRITDFHPRLKCDRSQPCDSCIRRSKPCHYASNATRGPAKQPSASNRKFVDRLENLESLVSSFIEKSQNTSEAQASIPDHTPSTKHDALTPETPRLQTADDGQVNYIDPSHWQSILEDIREVRDHLSPPTKMSPSGESRATPIEIPEHDAAFVFGSRSDLNIEDILAALPPQPICDMMLSWYFSTQYMVLGKSSTSVFTRMVGLKLCRYCASIQVPK